MIRRLNRWSRKGQQGVSLLLALIFVAFFGGILVVLTRFNSYEIRKSEAGVSGWEMVEIAKAARLYVRDHYAADPAIRTAAQTPQRIPLSTLKSEGYLPQTFGRSSGGNDISALNQPIYVILTNWSPNGMGGSITDPATVPSAFVYFAPGSKSTSDLVVDQVSSARKSGASITAPLFDRSGANKSSDCRSTGPAAGIWDTGCMTAAEFASLVGPLGLDTTLKPGALVMPAWKAVNPDLRAVMRFPQPENPGYATMLTDLGMGTPTGDCTQAAYQVPITTTDASGHITQTTSDVCDALSDDASNDRRFNIDHIGNIMAQRVIAMPQTTDYGGETASIGTANDDAMRITGNAYLGNDLRVFNTRTLPAGVSSRFDVPNGTLAIERNVYAYSQNTGARAVATVGQITTANALISDNLTSSTFVSNVNGTTSGAPQMNVTTRTTLTGDMSVTGDPKAEFITEDLNAPNATVTATDTTGQVQVTGTMAMHDSTMTVNGTAPVAGYSAVVGEISQAGNVNVTTAGAGNDLNFLSPSSSITTASTGAYDGSSPLPTIGAEGRCLEGTKVANACPERQYFPPNITP
jgi:hypothetical protein